MTENAPNTASMQGNVNRPVLEISSDTTPVIYVNNVELNASIVDFTFDLRFIDNATPEKTVYRPLARLVMSPTLAKAVSLLLHKMISAYEGKYGELPIPSDATIVRTSPQPES